MNRNLKFSVAPCTSLKEGEIVEEKLNASNKTLINFFIKPLFWVKKDGEVIDADGGLKEICNCEVSFKDSYAAGSTLPFIFDCDYIDWGDGTKTYPHELGFRTHQYEDYPGTEFKISVIGMDNIAAPVITNAFFSSVFSIIPNGSHNGAGDEDDLNLIKKIEIIGLIDFLSYHTNDKTKLSGCFFQNCKSLTKVFFSNPTMKMPRRIFENCPLEQIEGTKNITTVEISAFRGNHFYKNNENILDFSNCSWIDQLAFTSADHVIGDSFINIILGPSLDKIEKNAFSNMDINFYLKCKEGDPLHNLLATEGNLDVPIALRHFYFYSETKPEVNLSKYWHYVNGKLVTWDKN